MPKKIMPPPPQEPAEPITIQTLKRHLLYVKRLAAQPRHEDRAHFAEDELHIMALTAIANGAEDYRDMAKLALETEKLYYERRYS